MCPYQIKESSFSKIDRNVENISYNMNQKNIDKLCYELNQNLLLGGYVLEDYCAKMLCNYESLIRVANSVYLLKLCRKENKKNYEPIESSDNESSSTDHSSYSIKRHVKRQTVVSNDNNEKSHKHIKFNESSDINNEEEVKNYYEERVHTVKQITNDRQLYEFDKLTYPELCRWLITNGFEFCGSHLPNNIKSGLEFRCMPDEDWGNFLGISSDMDKKKLRLLISNYTQTNKQPILKINSDWITQWLDDIGLGQYKYEILRRKIDGVTLNNLTFKDVKLIGIYNPIHQCSLKRSIQLFRQQQFHPCYLKAHANTNLRKNIAFWTTSDVASWLKNIKMPKKIKYLRNSGINGALLLLEPRVNSNTLIDMLKVKSRRSKKKIKNEFDKILPYLVIQDKDLQFRSNTYIPIFKNQNEEKKYVELFSSMEADDLLLCPLNLGIDPKYKVPPPLVSCPVHNNNNIITNVREPNNKTYF